MALDSAEMEKINQKVYREYPEMHGVRPAVTTSGGRHTLVYKTMVLTPAGPMQRVVRAVADDKGHIERLSTSK
jgi:hypothetical protein